MCTLDTGFEPPPRETAPPDPREGSDSVHAARAENGSQRLPGRSLRGEDSLLRHHDPPRKDTFSRAVLLAPPSAEPGHWTEGPDSHMAISNLDRSARQANRQGGLGKSRPDSTPGSEGPAGMWISDSS